MFSERIKKIPPSPIRKLYAYANEAKRKGKEIYHLNIGQPDIPTPNAFWNSIQTYREKVLMYGPSDGLYQLKEVVANYYNKFTNNVQPDDIFITIGASESILFSYLLLANKGDNFLIPEPCYANYITLGMMSEVKLIPIPTSIKDGYHLPGYNSIKKLITNKTKGIIICSPNNPTGTIYTDEELEMIAKIAKEKNLFIISDEVYREFIFNDTQPKSMLNFSAPEKTIVIDSISKRFSACGARIGFIVTKNKEAIKLLMLCGMARLCPPTLEQIGAIECFHRIDEIIKNVVKEYKIRRDIAYEELNKIEGAYAPLPEGAFYIPCSLPVDDADAFSKWLLTSFDVNNKTTMLAPMTGFYITKDKGKNEVRIAYVLKKEKLKDAINIIKEGIEVYKERTIAAKL